MIIERKGGVALAEFQILKALIMNPSEHGVIDSFSILLNGGNEILDNSIISHLPFPFGQIGIHIIASHEIILIIDAVLL